MAAEPSQHHPHFGFTRHGLPVHLHTADHRGGGINKRVGVAITVGVGSMWAAYIFALVALLSLPAILTQAFHLHVFPSWLINVSLIDLVAWVSSYFLQLTLLPIIIVGQNAQAAASDARAAKTFEDAEITRADVSTALDRLDIRTAGGITDVLTAIRDVHATLLTMRPGEGSTSDVP